MQSNTHIYGRREKDSGGAGPPDGEAGRGDGGDSHGKSKPDPQTLLVMDGVGSLTAQQGEHGVGLVKRDYLKHELGEEAVDAMRKIKLALDPFGLLNPDHVVRIEKPKRGEVSTW
jgi:hypothetical protein